MEIVPGVLFYIYFANLSANNVSVSKQIIVALATDALPYFIHALSDAPAPGNELTFDSTTH